MRRIVDKLEAYNMDNIKDVRILVKKIHKYLRLHNNYADIEILQSQKFRQIFIAHNIGLGFKIYNSWDFKKDMHNMLVQDYYNQRICDQEKFINELENCF